MYAYVAFSLFSRSFSLCMFISLTMCIARQVDIQGRLFYGHYRYVSRFTDVWMFRYVCIDVDTCVRMYIYTYVWGASFVWGGGR